MALRLSLLSPKTEVRPSPIHGSELFALAAMRAVQPGLMLRLWLNRARLHQVQLLEKRHPEPRLATARFISAGVAARDLVFSL